MTRVGTWHTQPERGSSLGMRIMLSLYRVLGRRLVRLLLYPVVTYFFLTAGPRRRSSLEYLRRVYADPEGRSSLGRVPGLSEVFRNYLEFGITILDRIGFYLERRERFEITIQGEEHLDAVAKDGRGALILGSHLGSFEAMCLLASRHSPIRVHVLMYTRHAARINALLRRLSEFDERGLQVHVIEIHDGGVQHALSAKAAIARGEVVAILADRVHPGEANRVAPVTFLGERAQLPQGPMLLGNALGCPVLFMTGLRVGERRYAVHVEAFADTIELPRARRAEAAADYCQQYAGRLEDYCIRAPLQWFNFYDFWAEIEDERS